jgi:hypothetical protein
VGHPLVRCAERVKKSQALRMTIFVGVRKVYDERQHLRGEGSRAPSYKVQAVEKPNRGQVWLR